MIKKAALILLLSGLLLSASACDRKSRSLAEASVPGDTPEYAAASKVSLVSSHAHLSELLPSGAGPDGKALYGKVCAACHQLNGQGLPGAFPPLVNSSYVTSDKIERLAAIMIYGLQGPIKVNGVEYNGVMTAQINVLNEAELAAVATYIRQAWGNNASPVEESIFIATRKKYGDRGMFTIEELGWDE